MPKKPSRSSEDTSSYEPTIPIAAKFRKNLTDLMKANPEGLRAFELNHKYKEMFGSEFSMQDHGCQSISEFCQLLPDIFVTETIPGSKGELGIFPANVDRSSK